MTHLLRFATPTPVEGFMAGPLPIPFSLSFTRFGDHGCPTLVPVGPSSSGTPVVD